jgi:rhodanese-related sulfurtransferase
MFLIALLFAITTKADVPRLQPAELRAAMQKGEAIAVDVRGTVPYELEHIADAVWIPLGVIKQRGGELPEDKLLITYCTCRAEETSLEGAMLLSSMGFKNVAVLQGGFPAWKKAGLPVASNRTPAPTTDATPSPAAATGAGRGRLAPPAAVTCDHNKLTSYAGTVRDYKRGRDKTSLTIDTSADTTERLTIPHPGSDDPSRSFLLLGAPFTSADWNRIERKKGELHPGLSVVAWVCDDGKIVLDWHPGTRFTGGE